jgi:putative MATE family efflux protein
MFFQTMYNVVDTWAAGLLSTEALAALSASFPVFFLVIAVAHGCQAATNALVSQHLGADQGEQAGTLSAQALIFAGWMGVLVAVLGWWSCPLLLGILELEGEPLRLGVSYLRTIFISTPFFAWASTLNGILSAHGSTKPFRNAVGVSFLLNIPLDLWLIYGDAGMPALGFPGIALATTMLQILTCAYLFRVALKSRVLPHIRGLHLLPHPGLQLKLLGQGFPAMVNMLTIAGGIYIYTWFAAGVGTHVVAAMGISMRIEQIVLLPSIGLNTAAMTLSGHALGSRNPDRLKDIFKTCLKFGLWIFLLGGPLVAGFAPFWMSVFTSDPQVIQIGALCLRISMLSYLAYVLLFTVTSMLQGLQRPMFAIWIGTYRQVLAPWLLVPVLMNRLVPEETGIWWGVFASVWSGALISFLYGIFIYRRIRVRMEKA